MEDSKSKHNDDPRLRYKAKNTEREINLYSYYLENGRDCIRCGVCDVTIISSSDITPHENGRLHIAAIEAGEWNIMKLESEEKGYDKKMFNLDMALVELGLNKEQIGFQELSPTQKNLDDASKEIPIIGMEFLLEVKDSDFGETSKSNCMLCEKSLNLAEVRGHIVSAPHRLKYLKSFFPTVSKKFSKVANLEYWQPAAHDFLESVAMRIEKRFGRQKILTVEGTDYLTKNFVKIKTLIKKRDHCEESETLNFKMIPDPFGSFLHLIPNEEITLDGEPDQKNAEKISHIRREAEIDNRQQKVFKYKKEIKNEDVEQNQDDEDMTDMSSLKLRKSGRQRGLKSKFMNRSNKSSDRDHRLQSPQLMEERGRKKVKVEGNRVYDRNISPYVVAMENWNKFKREEGTLLKQVEKRREMYQKRPEDHPNYTEEWKVFWKQRYNELVLRGIDPKTYDFKADWIPYWEKKLLEFFDVEILDKTEQLMKKFNLSSVDEPKRSDFVVKREPSPSPPRKHRHTSPRRDRHNSPRRDRNIRRSRSPRSGRRDYDYRHRSNRSQSRERSPYFHRNRRSRSREESRRSRSQENSRRSWNPSPPRDRRRELKVRDRRDHKRAESQRSDLYSGLSELEHRRDKGRTNSRSRSRSRSWSRDSNEKVRWRRSEERIKSENGGSSEVVSVLRVLSALEDSLGSLGPSVNQILARCMSLENNRKGTSNVILEDPDCMSILEMVKEKLHGQLMASLLSGSRENAVKISLDNITRLLQNATKKRSQNPAQLLNPSQPKAKTHFSSTHEVNLFLARSISTVLVQTDFAQVSDQNLEELVHQLMQETVKLDTDPEILRISKEFNEAVDLEKKITAQQEENNAVRKSHLNESYQRSNMENFDDSDVYRHHFGSGPAYVTPTYIGEPEEKGTMMEDEDNFTTEELMSLLNNFESLTKDEQADLIQFLKKLEKTNPEKVRNLWPYLQKTQKTEGSKMAYYPAFLREEDNGREEMTISEGYRKDHSSEHKTQAEATEISSDSDFDIICDGKVSNTKASKGNTPVKLQDKFQFKVQKKETKNNTMGHNIFGNNEEDDFQEGEQGDSVDDGHKSRDNPMGHDNDIKFHNRLNEEGGAEQWQNPSQ